MRAYLLYLVGIMIFMVKSPTYTNVIYLWYFQDFEWIHDYNWGAACLINLYSKYSEGFRWKMKQVTGSITLLTIIFIGFLIFQCHFHFIFTTLLIMICVCQTFLGLDPSALPMHLRLGECTDLRRGYAACYCICPSRGNYASDPFRVYLNRLVVNDTHFNIYVDHCDMLPFEEIVLYSGWLACRSCLTTPYLFERIMQKFGYTKTILKHPFVSTPPALTRR